MHLRIGRHPGFVTGFVTGNQEMSQSLVAAQVHAGLTHLHLLRQLYDLDQFKLTANT